MKFSVKYLPQLNSIDVFQNTKDCLILELHFDDKNFPEFDGNSGTLDGTDCALIFDNKGMIASVEFDCLFKNPIVIAERKKYRYIICIFPPPENVIRWNNHDNFQSCYSILY